MAKRNRDTLKHFFSKGSLPSEDQFHDLIDSAVNQIDEGFDKSPDHGLEITPLGSRDGLISFFRNQDPEKPIWSINYGGTNDGLIFNNQANKTAPLTLGSDGKVGIDNRLPKWSLDVNGVVAAKGRIGVYKQGLVPADGKWHDLTDELSGVHAFEIIAGAGKKKTGRYALIHAFALNCFNPLGWFFNFLNRKKAIDCRQAYYRSMSDKLKLRWRGDNKKYYLQVKSNSDYGDDVQIRYYLTQLWFDEDMSESWQDVGRK